MAKSGPIAHVMAAIQICFCVILCISSVDTSAQVAQNPTFHSFHPITVQEGLSQSTNAFVFRDSHGFVWISSVDGLNRFDGRRVKVYKSNMNERHSLNGAIIQSSFFEDSNGDLWFATDKSINCYRRQTDDFEHFFISKGEQTFKDSIYHAFYLDVKTNLLWVKAANELFKFDTQTKESAFLFETKAMRFGVQKDKFRNKIRLFSCFWHVKEGLYITEYDTLGNETSRSMLFEQGDSKLKIRQCFVENDSLCWFATTKGLLYLNVYEPHRYVLYTIPGEGSSEIRSISPNLHNELVVSTAMGGLRTFSLQRHSFSPKLPVYLKGKETINDIQNIYDDLNGNLWCAKRGEGVYFSKLIGKRFYQPLLNSPIDKIDVAQVYEDRQGRIWCLSERGQALILSNGKLKEISKSFQVPLFTRLYINEEKLFGLSRNGNFIDINSETGAQKLVVDGLDEFMPICLTPLSKNEYYIGTYKGLVYVNSKQKTSFKISSLGNVVNYLFKDKNRLVWLSDGQNLQVLAINNPTKPEIIHTIYNAGVVNYIIEDPYSNKILVASSNGLHIIHPNTFEDILIDEKSGLPNQYIHAVIPEKCGNFWLSSNQGIIKYMPYKPIGQQFKQYTFRNGLSSNEYCPGSALMSSTGEIWFGSTKGVDVFHPDSITDYSKPPKLAIVGLKVHDRAWPWDTMATTSIEMATQIQLKYNENTIRLELAAMEYTDPEMNKFRVRLLKGGNDTSWVDLGTQNFITYANLRPGKYRFEFTACNAEGIWQETPKSLEIVITPHFSDTWQFKVLLGGLALALIGFGTAFYYRYQLRLQQLALEKQQREAERKQLLLENELALQEERNRIADEMHDELGGGLSTIRLASQRAKKVQSADELQHILKRVSQISIGLVNNMRGIIWAMDSQNDSLQSLIAYIRQYAVTFLDDNGIEAQLSMPEEFPEVAMSSQYRHNIMLTVKECLNNILKHADASKVELSIDLNHQLKITIRDNGKGFEPVAHAGMGKGLRTTVKRMESLGGSIEWKKNTTGGMCVFLQAPLP